MWLLNIHAPCVCRIYLCVKMFIKWWRIRFDLDIAAQKARLPGEPTQTSNFFYTQKMNGEEYVSLKYNSLCYHHLKILINFDSLTQLHDTRRRMSCFIYPREDEIIKYCIVFKLLAVEKHK